MRTFEAFAALLIVGTAARAADSRWTGDRIACGQCHEQVLADFRPTAHGKAMEFAGGRDVTCGSCHTGDLAKHMETSDPQHVRNPRKLAPEAAAEQCMSCHATDGNLMMWRGSQHQTAGVNCLSCHSVHHPNADRKLLTKRTEAETCFGCHGNVRKSMLQRSTHLFRDERGVSRIQCYSCHNPHGSHTERLISANSINDKCYQCHQEKRGPFLWEHAPVRENCMNCHSPHGSNNDQLLSMRRPQLCQSCHLQGRHQTVAGRPNAMFNINRACQNCHTQPHGTNHPSGPILMR
jgi:DmsE family decaheme c-type cytochrome